MSYANPDDVKGYFRELNTGTDAAVTDAKIQKWLDSFNIYLVGKLSILYSIPITAIACPLSALILAEIEAMHVAGIVDDILNNYSEADKKPQWTKRAKDMLTQYIPDIGKDGKQPEPMIRLPDAVYNGTRTQTGRIAVSSTETPVFTKGGDNW